MAQQVEQRDGGVDRWSIYPWIFDAFAFMGTATLAPTVALPGCWVLFCVNSFAFLYSIQVSSDTAIGIHVAGLTANPNLTAGTARPLDHGLSATLASFQAQVVATPANAGNWSNHRVPANDSRELLFPMSHRFLSSRGVVIFTDLVAASVSVNLTWVDLAG